MRSDVRVVPGPPFLGFASDTDAITAWGHSSAGRAVALQASGRRFDPDWLHHSSPLAGRGSNGFELVLSYPENTGFCCLSWSNRTARESEKQTSFRGNVAGLAARAGPVRLCSASIRFSCLKRQKNRSFCFFDRVVDRSRSSGCRSADIDHESDQVS